MDTSEFTREQLAKAAETILKAYNNDGKYEEEKIREAFSKAIDEMYDSARKFHKGQEVYTFEDPGWPCNPMIQRCVVYGSKVRKQGAGGVMVAYDLDIIGGRRLGWVDEVRVFATKEELQDFYLQRLDLEELRHQWIFGRLKKNNDGVV